MKLTPLADNVLLKHMEAEEKTASGIILSTATKEKSVIAEVIAAGPGTDDVKVTVKKGDKVVVLAGRDKGKTGEVLQVLPKDARAVVRGVNLVKRHTKQSQTSEGGIISKEATIDLSNIAVADPKDGKATRVGFKVLEDGRKVRFAKRSGDLIDG